MNTAKPSTCVSQRKLAAQVRARLAGVIVSGHGALWRASSAPNRQRECVYQQAMEQGAYAARNPA